MSSSVRMASRPAGMPQLELVTSVHFAERSIAARPPPSPRVRRRLGLFHGLLAVIALSGMTTLGVVWYMRHELPVAQKRARESEALLAPPSQSFCRRTRPPLVCAHGGDTTHAPANTVSAFRAALAAGADCVEVDAALSRDGVLVVLHVRELAQLLGRGGRQVGDLASSELLALRWPSGEAVMSVEEAVRLTSPFVSCVTLDVKTYNDESGQPLDELAIAEALVQLVSATRCANCLIWAKSDRVVQRILQLAPGQRTGYIVMNETEESRQLGMHHPLRFSHSTADRFGPATATAATAAPGRNPQQQQQRYLDQLPTHGSASTHGSFSQAQDAASGGFQDQDAGEVWLPEEEEEDEEQAPGAGRPRRPGGAAERSRVPTGAGAGPSRWPLGRAEREAAGPVAGAAAQVVQVAARAPEPAGSHYQPAVVGVHHAMVEPQLLQLLHSAGKQLFAWTVNQADVLRSVLDVGVDAVVTNYPLTALEAIDSRLAKCGALRTGTGMGTAGAGRGGRGAGQAGRGSRWSPGITCEALRSRCGGV